MKYKFKNLLIFQRSVLDFRPHVKNAILEAQKYTRELKEQVMIIIKEIYIYILIYLLIENIYIKIINKLNNNMLIFNK